MVCIPGCPVQPDNMTQTLLELLYTAAGRAPMMALDDALRPKSLFSQTVHEGCDRGGYYEQAEFAEEYGSRAVHREAGLLGPGGAMQRRPARLDGRNRRLSERGRHLHRLHHARLSRQIHAIHGSAAGLAALFERGDDLRPSHSCAAPLHAGIAQSRAELAFQPEPENGDVVMIGAVTPPEAEAILAELASVFFHDTARLDSAEGVHSPNVEARYRALVEQIPAVVFMAYLDRGIGEAYVSPQIEKTLGFSQSEWLEDPVRWYQQIHPDDKLRWSVEAAQMFLSGQPLRSAYRVIARDGRVIWFHCEAKMIRREDGRPWFIHGVAFDITELKQTEAALEEERNVASAILDTVGALVVVLDPDGRIVRFNRACERTTGYEFAEVQGHRLGELFLAPEESGRFQSVFDQLTAGGPVDRL